MSIENPDAGIIRRPKEEHSPRPEDVRLSDGSPLYYILLKNVSDAGIVNPRDSETAHDLIRELFALDPEKVLSCEGKSPEAAGILLASIEPHQEAA